MLDITLLKNICITSIASSIISTEVIQIIKDMNFSYIITNILNFLISILIGISFTLTFTDLTFYNSLWVGLISFIGADIIYKMFEENIFNKNENITIIERNDI